MQDWPTAFGVVLWTRCSVGIRGGLIHRTRICGGANDDNVGQIDGPRRERIAAISRQTNGDSKRLAPIRPADKSLLPVWQEKGWSVV